MQNKTGIIYKLTFPNGKSYIGLTRHSLKNRIARHIYDAKNGSDFFVHRAIRKYGTDSIIASVIANGNLEDLPQMEIDAIAAHNTLTPNGYNLNRGGQGNFDFSIDSRKRIGAATKKRWENPDYKKRMSNILNSRFTDEERAERKKLSIEKNKERQRAKRSRWMSPEHRAKLSTAQKARVITSEHRAKILLSIQNRLDMSEEGILRRAYVNELRSRTPEQKKFHKQLGIQKTIERNKARVWDDEACEKLSRAVKSAFSTPESKQKRSEAQKARYANLTTEQKEKYRIVQKEKWTDEMRAKAAERTRIQMANQTIEVKIAAYEKRYGEGSYQAKLEKEAKKIADKALRDAKKAQPKIKLSREEINRRIAEGLKNSDKMLERNAKVSAILKGRKLSDEHRRNLSASRKARHNFPNDNVTEI